MGVPPPPPPPPVVVVVVATGGFAGEGGRALPLLLFLFPLFGGVCSTVVVCSRGKVGWGMDAVWQWEKSWMEEGRKGGEGGRTCITF